MRRLNLVVAGAIVLAGIALLPIWRPIDPDLDAPAGVVGMAPPGITTALRETAVAGDRLFNPQPWGSWFEFALPDLPVAIDSRIELFPAATWDAYENVVAGGDGWAEQLADWGVTMIVVEAGETKMARSAGGRRLAVGLLRRGRIDHGRRRIGSASAFVAHWSTNTLPGPSGAVPPAPGW